MVTQKFDLNMIPGKPKPIIRASQYDTGLRVFEVSLFAGTDTYTIPSGATLTVQGTKPDYTGFSYSATYSGNTVTFDCTDQMTACAGAVEMEIAVVNEGKRVATANFVLQVEPAALKDDTIISETDIPIIEQLPEMMEDVNTLISTFGGPNVAETAAEMTDQDKVYVYIGSETGYNSGHWYYYDKTAHVWKDGGIYQSAGVEVDNTLSIGGMAADAKATGDALALKADIASPTFTGDPKAPTASLISYNTQIANTEFVQRLVLPLDDAVNGLEPTEIEMHLVVDGTIGTWAQGGKTNIYDLLPGDNVEVTAGERDAYLVWYTTQGGSEAVNVSTSHTVTAGAIGRWGTTDARKLAVLMEDTSGNDVSPASFTINGVEKGLNERVDALETTKQDTLTFDTTPTEGSTNPVTSGGAWEAVQTDKTLAVEDKAADAKVTGDAVTELKNDLILSSDGQQSVGVLSEFVQGATYNGEIQTYGKNRVVNVNLITFSQPTQVTISSGFWILISFFVNGAFTSQTSWTANFYNIPAGSTVRFSIRRVTEQSSEVADIHEFTRAVTINTNIQNQINDLNTNLSGQVAALTTKVNQAVKSYGQISAANIGSLGWTSVTDFDANRIYGIGSDITNDMVTDLPYYGGYGQLKITAGIFPNIYKKYEYTNALNDTWIAWQNNNNTSLSAWKKLASAESVSFKTVADRTQINSNSKVIFIGDSIVAGVGGTGWQQTSGRKLLTYDGVDLYANDEGTCWANMMRDYLITNYGCTAYNNGLSGFNSVNIPQNIAQLVPSDTTHVIACWGINDRAYNYDTVGGYQTVIDYCNSIGAKIVPVTICPCLQPNDTYGHTQYEILTRIKTVCENNNFEVCDLFSEVHEYFYIKGITLDTNYIPDKLHPNDAMYAIMYHLMKKLLGV